MPPRGEFNRNLEPDLKRGAGGVTERLTEGKPVAQAFRNRSEISLALEIAEQHRSRAQLFEPGIIMKMRL